MPANESLISITILHQAGKGLRDEDRKRTLEDMLEKDRRQRRCIRMRVMRAVPRVLVVPE